MPVSCVSVPVVMLLSVPKVNPPLLDQSNGGAAPAVLHMPVMRASSTAATSRHRSDFPRLFIAAFPLPAVPLVRSPTTLYGIDRCDTGGESLSMYFRDFLKQL